MEIISLPPNLKVFGFIVTSFPNGIGEAFDQIINKLPTEDKRPYYGISQCIDGKVKYIAAAEETYPGEGAKYGYESFDVEGGEYLSETVLGWISKTEGIKDVLEGLMKDERAHKNKPCVEIYKNDDEMLCLVKLSSEDISPQLEDTFDQFLRSLSSFDEESINEVPFKNSWTAGQVAEHIRKSIDGMDQLLAGPTKKTERDPGKFINDIKKTFLDFSIQMQSPDFIIPEEKKYNRTELIEALTSSSNKVIELSKTLNKTETCLAFSFPVYGELTRLEILNFVVAHTKRHNHQLQKINRALHEKLVQQ